MQLIRHLHNASLADASVATIGNFDGAHLGHQAMFSAVTKAADERGLSPTVVSFEPLPHEYFAGDQAPPRLQGLRDRLSSMAEAGIERVVLLPFNASLAAESAEHFIERVLVQGIDTRHLVIGDDFRFGHQRRGDLPQLREAGQQHGFSVASCDTLGVDGERVSSSRIRACLQAGDLDGAARLLGRPYRISGRVIHGEKLGRTLGYPTANVALQGHEPPLRGVFAAWARAEDEPREGGQWPAVVNLGERPTIGGRRLLLEVHVLDDSPALYGRHLAIDFVEHLRGEQRFDSLDALKTQITRDAEQASRVLATRPRVIRDDPPSPDLAAHTS